MPSLTPWNISGSYFEACSCEAVCPCRRIGGSMGRDGGRSTYGVCDFVLSWWIRDGRAGEVDLRGLTAVMAGSYNDDEPGSPWRVVLYVDERGDGEQRRALSEIFLGRVGGTPFRNFAAAIGEVYDVRPARISLDHTPDAQRIEAGPSISVQAAEAVEAAGPVSCGIPGHDHPGIEIRADHMRVDAPPLTWNVSGRCGFASDFDYRSDPA
jgi:hypothetical protein